MLCDRDGLCFGTLSCRPSPHEQEMTVMAWHADGDCDVKMMVPSSRFGDKESVLQLTKLFVEKWKSRPRRKRDSRFITEHFDATRASGRSRQAREILNRFASRRPWLFEQKPKQEKDSIALVKLPTVEPRRESAVSENSVTDADRLRGVMQRLSQIKGLIDVESGQDPARPSHGNTEPTSSSSHPDLTAR